MMLIPHPDWPGAQHPGNQAHQNREHTTGADSCPSYRSTAQHTRHPRAVVVDLRMLVLHHCLEATLDLPNRRGKAPVIHAGGPIRGMIRANECAVPYLGLG